MNSEKIKTISEIIKNVVEVLALIVAGLWAYAQFQETESPSLELRSFSESRLSWFGVANPKYCGGQFGVSIRNIGKKSFEIKSAILRVWLVDQHSFDQEISYINPKDFRTEKPFFEKQFSDVDELALLTHFPPGGEAAFDFTFNFSPDKRNKRIALFSFFGSGSGLEIHQSRWGYLCDIPAQ